MCNAKMKAPSRHISSHAAADADARGLLSCTCSGLSHRGRRYPLASWLQKDPFHGAGFCLADAVKSRRHELEVEVPSSWWSQLQGPLFLIPSSLQTPIPDDRAAFFSFLVLMRHDSHDDLEREGEQWPTAGISVPLTSRP